MASHTHIHYTGHIESAHMACHGHTQLMQYVHVLPAWLAVPRIPLNLLQLWSLLHPCQKRLARHSPSRLPLSYRAHRVLPRTANCRGLPSL